MPSSPKSPPAPPQATLDALTGFGFSGGSRGGRVGRLFGSGDLRLLVLALIEQQPRHGYDIIRQIGELLGGEYSPSPGAIYPTLTLLEEQELVTSEKEGGKKRYTITRSGSAHMDEQRRAIEALKERLKIIARALSTQRVPEEVKLAMGVLKQQLIAHHLAWDEDEIERVRAILKRAAIDIADPLKSPQT